LKDQKGTKKSSPHRTAFATLRFPRSGSAPWARRHGPSMAHRGSPGIHAGRPTPQNLLSASREGRQIKSTTPRRPTGRPVWRKCVLHNLCSRCRRNEAAIFNANIGDVLNASVIKTLSSRPQPPAQHIQQITPITQQLRRNSSHMLKIYRVSLLHFPTGKRFHQLGDGQYASSGVGVKYVKGRVTVDQ